MKRLQPGIVICVSLIFLFLIIPLNLWAVEYPEESATTATDQEVVVYQDEATEKIQEMVEAGEPSYEPVKSAEDLAMSYLEKNGFEKTGWDSESKMFVAVGEASFDSEDPSYDDSFIIKRGLKSMEAVLNAKAGIIGFINTNMTAVDRSIVPKGFAARDKLEAEFIKAERKIEAKKQKIAKLRAKRKG